MRKLCFLTGLPRSGTTLLANLLCQNPDVHATATSGLLDTLRAVRDVCDKNPFFRAMDNAERQERKRAILQGVVAGYFDHTNVGVCFDKSRGWPTSFELASWILGERSDVRAIVCVRDMRDVLASFEKLYRVTAESSTTSQERADYVAHRTAVGRAQFMLRPNEPLGYARDVIKDAVTRGWRENMVFVEYDSLCHDPQGVVDDIYKFIDEPSFIHCPTHVEQVTREDDSVHSFVGLHEIRGEIKPQPPQWPRVFDATVIHTQFWAHVTEGSKFWKRFE